ncbi:MAG: hypothetical protein ABSE73_23115 [Planctomycetota bacterium]
MPRGAEWPLENLHILNNLLVRNTIAAEGAARGCELTVFMGCPGETYTRTVASNHSDYNVYADGPGTPALRHSWNPDNTLQEWQQRFGEDQHSKLLPVSVRFGFKGTGFALLSREGLNVAGPLPEQCGWKAATPGQAGAAIMQWP